MSEFSQTPFDNPNFTRARYEASMRDQQVRMYEQSNGGGMQLNHEQLKSMQNQSRFGWGGVSQEHNTRLYRRREDMAQAEFNAGATRAAIDIAGYGIGSAGVGAAAAAMGIKGGIAATVAIGGVGMLAGGVAAAAGAALFAPSIRDHSRNKFANNISMDIDSYRDRIGLGNTSYGDITSLGHSMQKSMYNKGDFFNKQQQLSIHKIGLSEGLFNSGNSKGMNDGSIQEYKKNFEELKDSTKEIVRMLETTVEGGLSVMKELKQSGFKSMKDIKAQVSQAKSFGGITGIGSQNMMQLGNAGAQAVQGTGIHATVGANAYQFNATNLSLKGQNNAAFAETIMRNGGAAQAGATLSNMQFDILSSEAGRKTVAAVMNPKTGKYDPTVMDKIRKGELTGTQLVEMGNAKFSGSESDRVMFNKHHKDVLNEMSDLDRSAMVKTVFKGVSQHWGGTFEARTQKFSEIFGSSKGFNATELLAGELRNSDQYGKMSANKRSTEWKAGYAETGEPDSVIKQVWKNGMWPDIKGFGKGVVKPYADLLGVAQTGAATVAGSFRSAYRMAIPTLNVLGNAAADSFLSSYAPAGLDVGKHGIRSRFNSGDRDYNASQIFGTDRISKENIASLSGASVEDIMDIGGFKSLQTVNAGQLGVRSKSMKLYKAMSSESDEDRSGKDAMKGRYSKMNSNQYKRVMQMMNEALVGKDSKAIMGSQGIDGFLKIMGVDRSSDMFKSLRQGSEGNFREVLTEWRDTMKSFQVADTKEAYETNKITRGMTAEQTDELGRFRATVSKNGKTSKYMKKHGNMSKEAIRDSIIKTNEVDVTDKKMMSYVEAVTLEKYESQGKKDATGSTVSYSKQKIEAEREEILKSVTGLKPGAIDTAMRKYNLAISFGDKDARLREIYKTNDTFADLNENFKKEDIVSMLAEMQGGSISTATATKMGKYESAFQSIVKNDTSGKFYIDQNKKLKGNRLKGNYGQLKNSVRSELEGVGNITDKDIEYGVAVAIGKDNEWLKENKDYNKANIDGYIGIGGKNGTTSRNTWVNKIATGAAAAMENPELKAAKDNLKYLKGVSAAGLDGLEFVYNQKDDNGNSKEIRQLTMDAVIKAAEDKVKELSPEINKDDTGSQKAQITAPISNYWNNKWTL